MSKERKLETLHPIELDLPSWMDASLDRTIPYTEKELDKLVDGALDGIQDTASWQNLVDQVGQAEAKDILRTRLIVMDKNARKLFRH